MPEKSITWLNDHRPFTLTPVLMQSFEILVLTHLKDITAPCWAPCRLPASKTGQWLMHHGNALHLATPQFQRDLRKVPVYILQLRLKHSSSQKFSSQSLPSSRCPPIVLSEPTQELLIQFYAAISMFFAFLFRSVTKQDLWTIESLYASTVRKQAGKITADPLKPGHNLFQSLPSGRHYSILKQPETEQFSLHAVTLMNS